MALSIRDKLRAARDKIAIPKDRQQAAQMFNRAKEWFKTRLRNLIHGKEDDEVEVLHSYAGMKSKIADPFGRLSFFIYNAENDKKLPYWDAAPLTLLYGEDNDHIYGLNFHYVHPTIRAKILSSFIDSMLYANSERAYIAVTSSTMKALSNSRYIKPCLKTYLKSNFVTAPVVIKPEFWHNAIMLPTAQWTRASNSKVWKDSASKF